MRYIPTWIWIAGGILLIVALGAGGVMGIDYLQATWMSSPNARKWAASLAAAERDYGIPTGLLARIAYQESHFVQGIIEGSQSSAAGALGLMQLMPQYFQSVNAPRPYSDADTQAQIVEAAGLLAGLYGHFGDWTAAVAAYNAGQGTLNQVLDGNRALPQETANYLANIAADLPDIVRPTLTG